APSPGARPSGCTFAPRCTFVLDACRAEEPRLRELAPSLWVKCMRAEEEQTTPVSRSGGFQEIAQDSIVDAVLSLDHVFAGYGPVTVVHDVNLQVAPRECLALVGESGSGKTTLARCAARAWGGESGSGKTTRARSIGGRHRDRSALISLRGKPLADSARAR